MKKKLLSIVAFLCATMSWGQEDVTSTYLQNAEFEGEYTEQVKPQENRAIYAPSGWTVTLDNMNENDMSILKTSDLASDSFNGFTVNDETTRGTQTYWFRYRWGSNQTLKVAQNIANLPAGVYRLTADVLNYSANYDYTVMLYAGPYAQARAAVSNTKGDQWNKVSCDFYMESDGSIELGLSATNPSAEERIIAFDNFKLYRLGDEPSEEAPVSMTGCIANPCFDANTSGWTATTGAQNQGRAFNRTNGIITGGFFENWNPNPYNGTIEQTINNLPLGKYTLKLAAFRAGGTGNVQVFANDATTAVTSEDGTYYEVEATVKDGSLNIGIESVEGGANWMGLDNVSLLYKGGVDLSVLKETLADLRETATTLNVPENVMSAQCRTALEEALSASENVEETANALTEAITIMKSAVDAANNSMASYVIFNSGKIASDKVDGWTCTNGHAFHVNSWSTEGNSDGSNMTTPFLENWRGAGSPLSNGRVVYTLDGIEPGTRYVVKALVRVLNESGTASTGLAMIANNEKNVIDGGNACNKGFYDTYSVCGEVGEDGVLTFGFEVNDATFNWFSFKNITIARELKIVESSLTAGEKKEKFAVDEVMTLSTTRNDEITNVEFSVTDLNPTTPDEAVLCTMCNMTKLEDGTFSYQFPIDYVLYEGHEYKVTYTCVNETKDELGYLTRTEIGTLEINVNGSSKPFEFSAVKNLSITPDMTTTTLNPAEPVTVTLTFDGAVNVDKNKTFINLGQGVTAPFESFLSNEEKTEWSFVVPASELTGITELTLAFGFTDAEGKVVKGDQAMDAGSYFLVKYNVENVIAATEDLEAKVIVPANESRVESLSEITLTFETECNWITDETALAEGVTLLYEGRTIIPVTTGVSETDWKSVIVKLNEATTEPGNYTLSIARGMIGDDEFLLNEGGRCNPQLVYYFTVGAEIEGMKVTPATGKVESLKDFKVENAGGIDIDWNCAEKIVLSTEFGEVASWTCNDITLNYPVDDEFAPATDVTFTLPEGVEAVTEPGSYTLTIPAGLFILNEGGESNELMIVEYTIEGAPAVADLMPTEVEPADKAEVPAIDMINLTFYQEVSVGNWIEGKTPVLMKDGSEKIQVAFIPMGNKITIKTADSEPITTAGTYVLTIPAGYLGDMDWASTYGQSGHCNAELVYTFTVTGETPEVVYDLIPTLNPEEGSVSTLEELILQHTEDIDWTTDYDLRAQVKFYNKETNEECPNPVLFDNPEGKDYTRVLMMFDPDFVTKGTYVLELPEGLFGDMDWVYRLGGHANPALKYEFTVTGGTGIAEIAADATKVDVYTLNGVLVLKNADRDALKTLKKGIYVINGKKVVLK